MKDEREGEKKKGRMDGRKEGLKGEKTGSSTCTDRLVNVILPEVQ